MTDPVAVLVVVVTSTRPGLSTTLAVASYVTADTGAGFKDDKAVSKIIPCIRGFQGSPACSSNTVTSQPTIQYVPIYDKVTGTGNGTKYTIKGYAAFVVTGYQLPGVSARSWLTDLDITKYIDPTTGKKFGGSEKVLTGFFTQVLVSGLPGGGPNLGVTTPPQLIA